jgi:hypothetical protein
MMSMAVDSMTLVPRARRFTVAGTLCYRRFGDDVWFHGAIENVSRTGILFRVTEPVALATSLEVMFTLPAERSEQIPTRVVCEGSVVRTVDRVDAEGAGVAIAIERYRIERGELALA